MDTESNSSYIHFDSKIKYKIIYDAIMSRIEMVLQTGGMCAVKMKYSDYRLYKITKLSPPPDILVSVQLNDFTTSIYLTIADKPFEHKDTDVFQSLYDTGTEIVKVRIYTRGVFDNIIFDKVIKYPELSDMRDVE